MNYDWLRIAEQIKSISQNGLTYCNNPFDKERYHQLQNIAADIISNHSNFSQEKILEIFSNDQGYLTHPKFLMPTKLCLFAIVGGIAKTNHETSGIDWYRIDSLPELSLHRVMTSQILRLYEHSLNPDIHTDFD